MGIDGEERKMKNLYRYEALDGSYGYVKMLQPVGSWNREGCRHYALWQHVKKFLWFFIADHTKQEFWLDVSGFEQVK